MDKLIVAFATDDQQVFTYEHFGEAKEYLIFEITKKDYSLIATVTNKSPEEKMHGDPNKAKGVASLLKPYGVNVLISSFFGKNITRQQQKFVVILSNTQFIDQAIFNIQENFKTVVSEWEKGETRNYLRI